MDTHHRVAQRLQAYRSNPLASGINFTPATLLATRNMSSLITSGDKKLLDFKGSTAIGGKRGIGGRRATSTWPRPVQYVPEAQRDAALAKYDAELKKLKARSGKKIFKLTRAQAVAQGLPVPTRHDVQDSINFDVYEALCEALGVPVGTFVDTNVWNKAKSGLRNSGMTRDQLNAEYARLGIRGDAKESYYGSRELAYNNPNSRFFNVPYKDVLKGSVLTALGIIPLNNRNMNDVLRELEGQSEIQASGNIPVQTISYITDIATRRSELASSGDKVAQALVEGGGSSVVEEAPVGEGSSTVAEGDGDASESKGDKKKSKALLYGGIAVAVVAVGGLAYYYVQD